MLDHSEQYTFLKQFEEMLGIESVHELIGETACLRSLQGQSPRTIIAPIVGVEVQGTAGFPTKIQMHLVMGSVLILCDEPGCSARYISNDLHYDAHVEVELA